MCDNLHKIEINDSPNTNKTPRDNWTNVEDINFSGNLLTTIDSSIKTVPILCTLNLDQNRLTCIQNHSELPRLNTLSLSCNHINDLDEVDNVVCLPLLEALRLTGNTISRKCGLPTSCTCKVSCTSF